MASTHVDPPVSAARMKFDNGASMSIPWKLKVMLPRLAEFEGQAIV